MVEVTERPIVSIVTPSYNQAKFLEETILSVQDQDYPNLEHLIIDGGSTDGSVNIIRKHAQKLSYWVSEPDRGQSHAINKGFVQARGAILAWLNSDDMLMPGAVSRAVAGLREFRQADFVYGDLNVLDERTGKTALRKARPIDFAGLLADGDIIPQPSVFMRRSLLTRVGMLDETLHMAMDYDLWLRATAGGYIAYLPGPPLATARMHGSAKTCAQHDRFAKEILRILDRVYADPNTPANALAVKRAAYACAHWFSAYRCATQGQAYAEAARWLALSLATHPRAAWHRPLGTVRMVTCLMWGALSSSFFGIWKRHEGLGTQGQG